MHKSNYLLLCSSVQLVYAHSKATLPTQVGLKPQFPLGRDGFKPIRNYCIIVANRLFWCRYLFLLTFLSSCGDVKRDQYVAEGYRLFQANCANCHQAKGGGLSGLYPAITNKYVANAKMLSCIIKMGMSQPIEVNGKIFSRPMPPNPQMTDLEIAEIVTYLQNEQKVSQQLTSIDSVKVWIEQCQLSNK